MKIDKETLAKWKENAKKSHRGEWEITYKKEVYEKIFGDDFHGYDVGDFSSVRDDHLNHIMNSQPQNFIALIEKLERYEEALKIADELHMGHSMPDFSEFRRKYEDNRKALDQE